LNHHTEYLGQNSFTLKVIARTLTDRRTRFIECSAWTTNVVLRCCRVNLPYNVESESALRLATISYTLDV